MNSAFDRFIQGDPLPADVNRALHAWCVYYVRAEQFDRTLPGVWSRYDPTCWLVHQEFTSQSVRYAGQLHVETIRNLRSEGVTDVDIEHGLDRAQRLTYAEAERIAATPHPTAQTPPAAREG